MSLMWPIYIALICIIPLHSDINARANSLKTNVDNPPHIEMLAVLSRCPNIDVDSTRKSRSTQNCKEKAFAGIEHCRRKLTLKIKLINTGIIVSNNYFIVVDHVYDPVLDKRLRLLNPYVVRLKQDQTTQLYKLKFSHLVNSEAWEEVINKQNANYTGCDDSSERATCGSIKYNGKVILYSSGFCCSCDTDENDRRQPSHKDDEPVTSCVDPVENVQCPTGIRGYTKPRKDPASNQNTSDDFFYKTNIYSSKKLEKRNYNSLLPSLFVRKLRKHEENVKKRKMYENIEHSSEFSNITERYYKYVKQPFVEHMSKASAYPAPRVRSSGAQIRGGQDCSDRYTPPNLNPKTYHDSAHCLRFSDLWYGVYQLDEPSLEHAVLLQLYEKHDTPNGKTCWNDLTKGQMIRMGTLQNHYVDKNRTVSMVYDTDDKANNTYAINYNQARLLIPQPVPKGMEYYYPELKGGPEEYLVVNSHQLSDKNNQKCDIAGVGFEAFYNQPQRCSVPKDSGEFLALNFQAKHQSSVNIEIKADFNTVIRPEQYARITEIYTEGTWKQLTTITVKAMNSGLVSGSYRIKVARCDLKVPATWNSFQTRLVVIPPQHQHIFRIDIKGEFRIDQFSCTAEVLNSKNQILAMRRFRIQRNDRCICSWHCLCACLGSQTGLACVPMSLEHYHAAGFEGSLPITTNIWEETITGSTTRVTVTLFVLIITVMFLMGLIKALLGLCCLPIGVWGLEAIIELPKKLDRYYESSIEGLKVRYDNKGWPVHPYTNERVRNIEKSTEFCWNISFFFVYPIAVIIQLIQYMCCPVSVHTYEEDSAEHRSCRCPKARFAKDAGIYYADKLNGSSSDDVISGIEKANSAPM